MTMESRVIISYLELANVLKLKSNNFDCLVSFVKNKFDLNSEELELVINKMQPFHTQFNKKLRKCGMSFEKLLKRTWIQGQIEVVFKEKDNLKRKVGRPSKDFEHCADRTKRRKIQQMCTNVPKDQIERAAIRTIKKPVAKMVKQIMESNVSEVKEYSNKLMKEDVVPLSENEALLLFVEAKLKKHQYIMFRDMAKSRNADIFPPYYKLLEAKKQCYPEPSSIVIDEYSATIELQSLLNITAKRIIESLTHEQLLALPTHLTMHSKYGGDGASSQSQYKTSFATERDVTDSQIYMLSLVPLRIDEEANCNNTCWKNRSPGSPRNCRPMRFIFAKENRELTIEEMKRVQDQIVKLEHSVVSIGGRQFFIGHKLYLTMIDGKTCMYISNTDSAANCVVCKATPNEMNDLEKVSRKIPDESVYEYGLSPLHAKIRFMEYILHVAYNLPFENWRATKKSGNDKKKQQRKGQIQDGFRQKLGIYVDFTKQGPGSTNDGNTARRFFENPEITAEITMIDEKIIKRCAVILQTLACGRDIDPDKFDIFALDTYKLFIKQYVWYKMPSSVHKILLHGAEIIKFHIIPIGQLTEEAAEARNKDFRRFREGHTRKFSRVATNEDILNALLISSDPLISSMRTLTKKKFIELPQEVKNLLLFDEFNDIGDDDDNGEE